MKVTLSSIVVNDQARAREFYIEKLGFMVKVDIPMGEYSWLTVTSPEGVAGVELVLEPAGHPAAREYQQALYRDGIPATSFESSDIRAEFETLCSRGVVFRAPPSQAGPAIVAAFDDTCGNWIQLHQVQAQSAPQ